MEIIMWTGERRKVLWELRQELEQTRQQLREVRRARLLNLELLKVWAMALAVGMTAAAVVLALVGE
jgi:hypothetical protein